MKCPVCPAADIPADARRCPVCGADLTAVQRVSQLPAALHAEAMRLSDAGAVDLALARALAAVGLDERFIPARTLVATLLWKKGQRKEAISHWQQAAALAPDDHQIKRSLASARMKLRWWTALRFAGPAAIAAAVVCLVLLLVLLPARTIRRGLKSVDRRLHRVERYRSTHRHPDSEFDRLAAELDHARDSARVATTRLDDYRATHSHPDAEFARLVRQEEQTRRDLAAARLELTLEAGRRQQMVQALDDLRGEVNRSAQQQGQFRAELDRLNSSLSAVGPLAVACGQLDAELRSVRAEVDGYHRWLADSLTPIFQCLRPVYADELARRIRELGEEQARLQARQAKYRDPSSFMDAVRLYQTRQKLADCQAELAARQAEYDARVAPWERGMEMLRSPGPRRPAASTQPGRGTADERR